MSYTDSFNMEIGGLNVAYIIANLHVDGDSNVIHVFIQTYWVIFMGNKVYRLYLTTYGLGHGLTPFTRVILEYNLYLSTCQQTRVRYITLVTYIMVTIKSRYIKHLSSANLTKLMFQPFLSRRTCT